MTGYYARPSSPVAGIALFLARLGFVTFVIAGLAHRYALVDTIGFFWVLGFIGAVVMASLALTAIAIARLWQNGTRGGRNAAKGGFIAIVTAMPFLVSAYWAIIYPPLNDISTDTADPPAFVELRAAGSIRRDEWPPFTPEEIERQNEAYPQVTGRRYNAAPDRVLRAIDNVIVQEGWERRDPAGERPEGNEITIEAIARTMFVGFRSAVAIRVIDEGESSYVDMRSASLFGKHDLGDNARRIEAFFKALDAEMIALAGT
ncbi:MAG: DUF1499 domain-containing protein [Notoacmeibacter sp.]|nr:DUF1499 domain-containing protein [Notoacmeibacter sp.]